MKHFACSPRDVVEPIGSVHSFGPGARTLDLVRDPLIAGTRSFRLDGGER